MSLIFNQWGLTFCRWLITTVLKEKWVYRRIPSEVDSGSEKWDASKLNAGVKNINLIDSQPMNPFLLYIICDERKGVHHTKASTYENT